MHEIASVGRSPEVRPGRERPLLYLVSRPRSTLPAREEAELMPLQAAVPVEIKCRFSLRTEAAHTNGIRYHPCAETYPGHAFHRCRDCGLAWKQREEE